MEKVDLYGGAITTELPKPYLDVSSMRDVPDNQEVFIFPGKDQVSDESVIIDLLEQVNKPLDEAVVDFAQDLIQPGDVIEKGPEFVEHVTNGKLGVQVATYYMISSAKVVVFINVVRIDKIKTDILVSLNCQMASVQVEGEVFNKILKKSQTIAKNLDIADYGLFIN